MRFIWSFLCEKFRLWVLGVVNSEGPHWEELRQFTLRQLRDFRYRKNTIQESILTEVNEFIELVVDAKGEPSKGRLLLAVVNALWFIVTGIRHTQDDPELIAFTKKPTRMQSKQNSQRMQKGNSSTSLFSVRRMSKEAAESGGVLVFLPWVAKWFRTLSGYNRLRKHTEEFAKAFQKPVDKHMKNYSEHYERWDNKLQNVLVKT